MQKRLLMLNASTHEIPFILAARKLGFYVITTSTKAEYEGHKYADEYVYGNYNDYEEMVALAKRLKIDAVSHACTDDCALSAAYIGERLGLKGHDTYENAQIIHRKDKFKEFALKNKVLTPRSYSFESYTEALEYGRTAQYPVIVKPTDLAGGQGIHVAENYNEFALFAQQAFTRSNSKKIVAERFLRGTLHSLCTFIVDHKVVAYCPINDYSFKNQYMTNSGLAPAEDWENAVKILIPETERIASILGLVDGQLHMQYILEDGKPYIIEMMRRNIGNNFTTTVTDFIGVNWPEWVMRAEAGMDCHMIPESRMAEGHFGYHMIMGDRNGTFQEIKIDPEFEQYVYQFTQWAEDGHVIENYMSEKLGNVLFRFPTDTEKKKYLPHINELVRVVYKEEKQN